MGVEAGTTQANNQAPRMDFGPAPLARESLAAIHQAGAMAEDVARRYLHHDVVALWSTAIPPFDDYLTLVEIAESIGYGEEHSDNVRKRAMMFVIDAAVEDKDEIDRVNHARRSSFTKRDMRTRGAEALASQLEKAREIHAQNVRDGKTIVNTSGLIEARGRVRYTPAEIKLLNELHDDPTYRQDPSHPGRPQWGLIAQHINREIHKGRTVRNGNSLFIRYQPKKAKK